MLKKWATYNSRTAGSKYKKIAGLYQRKRNRDESKLIIFWDVETYYRIRQEYTNSTVKHADERILVCSDLLSSIIEKIYLLKEIWKYKNCVNKLYNIKMAHLDILEDSKIH